MATRGQGGTQTPIPTGALTVIGNKAKEIITGILPDSWFGPGQPIEPSAPNEKPRIFDYSGGINLQWRPRGGDGGAVTFAEMRALADNYDILRLVIETRKDQVAKIPWVIRKKSKVSLKAKSSQPDPNDARVQKLYDFFEYPDGERSWQTWIRMILEEVLVVDALTLCPRRNALNEVVSLDIIDGTTIVRKIDMQGRTPTPDNVAYQQVIKGLPMANFTTDDLIYRPRNCRAHKIYGYSPVEQIIITVNMALRRQMSKLAYYTDGNVPEAIAQVPETWSADEITKFQAMFDVLAGDPNAQRRLKFVPALHDITMTKEAMLKDEMDEWLARVVCYAMSVSPTPFTKAVNRAAAQVSVDSALAEGLLPILGWLAELLNFVISRFLFIKDLEFAWKVNNETDGLKLAQMHKIYAEDDILDIDEIREELGRDPAEGKIDNGLQCTAQGRPPGPTGKGTGEQSAENTAAGDTATKEK